jgi:hypothetical protein
MGAFVSLAFGWEGSLADRSALHGALKAAGLQQRRDGVVAEGMHEAEWALAFAGAEIPLTARSYQEAGWVATTLDLDEELFESVADRSGRAKLVQALVHLGEEVLRHLHLPYIFFEEEAEADIAPHQYRADVLFGITLIADDVPGLEEALRRPDVQRIERFDGGVTLYRRFDPVPHYTPPEEMNRD